MLVQHLVSAFADYISTPRFILCLIKMILHRRTKTDESVEEMIKVFNVDPVKFRSFIISLELQLRNGRKLEYGLGQISQCFVSNSRGDI